MLGTHTHRALKATIHSSTAVPKRKGVGMWGEISENGSFKYKKQPMHIHSLSDYRKSWTETTVRYE
jgi:hypothetical protein